MFRPSVQDLSNQHDRRWDNFRNLDCMIIISQIDIQFTLRVGKKRELIMYLEIIALFAQLTLSQIKLECLAKLIQMKMSNYS